MSLVKSFGPTVFRGPALPSTWPMVGPFPCAGPSRNPLGTASRAEPVSAEGGAGQVALVVEQGRDHARGDGVWVQTGG